MKELVEKRNDMIVRAEEVLNAAKAEKRELTEDEAAELAEIRDNVRRIVETLKLDEDFREMEKMEVKEDNVPEEEEIEVIEERNYTVGKETVHVRMDEYKAMDAYIRGIERDDDPVNMTKTDNGKIIPTTIVDWVIRKVYDICPILDRSQKFNVKGKLDVPFYPADADNIQVAYRDEFVALTSTSGKFDTVELSGFLAGALTKVSRSLINNTEFDLVGFVVDEMAYAIKRWIEGECLNGTNGKITGLSTLTNGITAASGTAITADEVVRLHDSIKDEFQANAIWIMNPSTRTALRTLKGNTGYYLLNDDISTPFGTTLLGKPVYVSDNMPEMAAGEVAIYYGDMRGLATKFNEDISIDVLRERYADEHCYGVIGWLEFDAKVIDEQQIARLKMAGGGASE